MDSALPEEAARNTGAVKELARREGVALVGIAGLRSTGPGSPERLPDALGLAAHFEHAIVLGVPFGRGASGTEASLFLEKVAFELLEWLEVRGRRGLIIHTEDEIDPVRRFGLLSLKALAKSAGLGWQGRSLLVVSPRFGPVHRWIAVLTSLPLESDAPVPNRCGECSLCVDSCPEGALTLVAFADHPGCREDVLDIGACKGDEGCDVCLAVCPWTRPGPPSAVPVAPG